MLCVLFWSSFGFLEATLLAETQAQRWRAARADAGFACCGGCGEKHVHTWCEVFGLGRACRRCVGRAEGAGTGIGGVTVCLCGQ